MGIARTIERVRQQARQGGLPAVMAGLGEELRSEHVPGPLRSAAQRLAALLEAARPSSARRAAERSDDVRAEASASARPQQEPVANEETSAASMARPAPGEVSTHTGDDHGDEPGPIEPEAGTPVDPAAVGATPLINASPIEVQAIDATPDEVESVDATPDEVVPLLPRDESDSEPALAAALEEKPELLAELAPRPEPQAIASEAANSQSDDATGDSALNVKGENLKEEVAQSGEAAKNLARSTSRGAKKRSGSKANKTSKKK